MRVLIVHNRYTSRVPSGENLAVDEEATWLQELGIDVDRYEVNNDDAIDATFPRQLITGSQAVWSLSVRRQLNQVLSQRRPDVMHIHNVFPLLSPSVLSAARRAAVPVVWTVHNYRLACVAGTYFRSGADCHECEEGIPRLAGIRYGCYARSRAASAVLTASTGLFAHSARSVVMAVAVSGFVRRWLLKQGFPADRVQIKYNGVNDPGPAAQPPSASRALLFVGRLVPEKGISELLAAWRAVPTPNAELRIIGEGELVSDVRAAAVNDHRLVLLGQLERDAVYEEMARCRAVVLPSICDEAFPRTAVEALAHSRPVITSGRGGLGEAVGGDCGWIVSGELSLREALEQVFDLHDQYVNERGRSARMRYEAQFTPAATTERLLEIYREAIGGNAEGEPSARR